MADTKEHLDLVDRFCKVNDVKHLTTKYPLDKSSVIFDVGAYTGGWALRMYDLYECPIYCFEPVNSSFLALEKATNHCDDIVNFNFALSDKNGHREINVQKDGSSFFVSSGECELVKERDMVEVLDELNLNQVSLLKINIEGAEFDLLEHLIANDKLKEFEHIQIQYHREVLNFDVRRNFIQTELHKTHNKNYDYAFVWESWSKKT